MNMLSQHLQDFILLNGLQFSHIEDEFLRKVCRILPTREKIVNEIESIALSVENYIMKKIVDNYHISISYDDWTNGNQKLFLGFTTQWVKETKIKSFTLALCLFFEKATDDHLNFLGFSQNVWKITSFKILNEVTGIVSFNFYKYLYENRPHEFTILKN